MIKKENTKDFISDLKKLLKKYNSIIYINVSDRPEQESDKDIILSAKIKNSIVIDFNSSYIDKNFNIIGINNV